MNHPRFRIPAAVSLTLGALVVALSLAAQPASASSTLERICPIDRPIPDGLTIRSVKVTARRGSGTVEKELRQKLVGKLYTIEQHREAMKQVEDALTSEVNQSFEKHAGIAGGAGAAVVYTTPCVEIDDAAKSIDMIVRVFFLRVDFKSLANNLLTLPRSLEPSFYDKMPALLRAFDPHSNLAFDRRTGPTASLDLSTNLLELKPLVRGDKVSDSDVRLDFKFSGEKSVNNRFYQTKTDLKLSRARPGELVEQLDVGATFRFDDQPLSEMRRVDHAVQLGGQIKLRPRLGILNSVFLSGAFRGSTNKVIDQAGRELIGEKDRAGVFRALVDGRAWEGFTRFGVWIESAEATRSSASYQRVAGLAGYQREFGSGTQTLGIEALFGAGKAWGSVPLYARFFGGNNSGNFLYDGPDAPAMTTFPLGPLLRSHGETQATARAQTPAAAGGRSYWHANLNFAIPVPRWSRRLIPDEIVPFEGRDIRLNELLENFTIKTATGTIADDLLDPIIEEVMKNEPGIEEDAALEKAVPIAEARARKLVEKEIAPIIRFISHRANLYAVRPLVMFDASQINGVEGERSRKRFAAGGGIQLVIVVARAEAGYMHSLPRIPGEPKGNFVFRLTFQNLF